jgi:hypothetical protein
MGAPPLQLSDDMEIPIYHPVSEGSIVGGETPLQEG